MFADPGPGTAIDCQIRLLREADLGAYKGLRDTLLAGHPDAFTSDAETEILRAPESYRSRLSGGNGGANLFSLAACRTVNSSARSPASATRAPR